MSELTERANKWIVGKYRIDDAIPQADKIIQELLEELGRYEYALIGNVIVPGKKYDDLVAENDRLTAEVARLKCGLWQSKDHRIGLLKESFENIVDNYSNFDCRRWRSMMTDIIKIAKTALEI